MQPISKVSFVTYVTGWTLDFGPWMLYLNPMSAEGIEVRAYRITMDIELVRGKWTPVESWNWAELMDLQPEEAVLNVRCEAIKPPGTATVDNVDEP